MDDEARITVDGILETALYVADPERSAEFYIGLFGFEPILRTERLWTLKVSEHQVLLLFQRGASAELGDEVGIESAHDARGLIHLAFQIRAEDADRCFRVLEDEGIDVGRKQWPRGGWSLFFRDLDGHLVELAPASIWGLGTENLDGGAGSA